MNYVKFDIFNENLKEIYEKLIDSISTTQNYLTKIEICKIFKLLAKTISNISELVIGYYNKEIIITLQNVAKDKVHKVQIAAHDALNEWLSLEKIFLESEKKKSMEKKSRYEEQETNLPNNGHSKLNILRNLSKLNKCSSPDLTNDEIYSKGFYFY